MTFKVEKLSETQTKITTSTKEILLLGTAHISSQSVEEVQQHIETENPDHVCVELDAGRLQSIKEGSSWSSMDLQKVFKERRAFLLLANLVLSSFQRRLGSGLGMKPGDELKAAVDKAEEQGIAYSLCDRPIQITLQRAWACSNFWNKMKLLSALLGTAFTKEELNDQELESLKKGNVLESMMSELANFLPTVKEVLIDERDQYLATKIFNAPGKKNLAVIGAGHAPGIIEWFRKLEEEKAESDLEKISHIPPKKFISKVLPYIIPLAVVGLLAYAGIAKNFQAALDMGLVWVLANGICAALGALIALARPQTIIVAFLAAPITSMIPVIGVGFATGILEYFSRKPRVNDLENIQSDSSSLKGWYKNRVTRILLVFFLSSLGSSIGTFWAIPKMASMLSGL
ncbi:MAG: TraB/GumN family protein [Spirochaetaceae bacterium]|jgi:pheromone shutdown-related protein TraB|nr:TraB/GumN family protein [Spirochaetaceae bacterium]